MPADVVAAQLALAGVQPDADRQAQLAQLLDDVAAAADRPRRAVEGGQEAVADGLDLAPAPAAQLVADDPVVVLELGAPAPVAQPGQVLGRADDVGEHDRGQHAVDRRPPSAAR